MTEPASEVLGTIIYLFETDEGAAWSDEQIQHANRRWHELPNGAKHFLNELSSEDLENICIGEVRDSVDDEDNVIPLRLYGGKWQPVPPEVDTFLNVIWEFA